MCICFAPCIAGVLVLDLTWQLLCEHADGLRRRASQGSIEPMPVYFKVLDKRSAIVVGPTANALSVVAAEADRVCPAPAPAAAVVSCTRRRAALPRIPGFHRVHACVLQGPPQAQRNRRRPDGERPKRHRRRNRRRMPRPRLCRDSCFVCTPAGYALPWRT